MFHVRAPTALGVLLLLLGGAACGTPPASSATPVVGSAAPLSSRVGPVSAYPPPSVTGDLNQAVT